LKISFQCGRKATVEVGEVKERSCQMRAKTAMHKTSRGNLFCLLDAGQRCSLQQLFFYLIVPTDMADPLRMKMQRWPPGHLLRDPPGPRLFLSGMMGNSPLGYDAAADPFKR
jgi:hypothetical protein